MKDVRTLRSVGIICVVISYVKVVLAESGRQQKCMRNDDIGWREGNIYYCDHPVYQECCEVDREFICCEAPSVKTLREQLQLWGAVVLFALGILVLYVYFRRENRCCSSPTLSDSWSALHSIVCCKKQFKMRNSGKQYTNDEKTSNFRFRPASDDKCLGLERRDFLA